ncbi:MAG: phosphatase PAP2/dual specificity phosphatase family protein [Spirochaetia bacterium]|nr:phosphatase PAP2/dual specificity phosphatase family protein [Spirochaetia bacterium]
METSIELKHTPPARPTGHAFRWLLLLGSIFLSTYGLANWLASLQNGVPSIVFDWEKDIPFVPWSIVPYWIIDGLYIASVFACRTKDELNIHAKRLLSAQIIAVSVFILFPLRFAFSRPQIEGLPDLFFTIRLGLDQPFNQAPSLHIAFIVILWILYIRHLPKILIWPFHLLSLSIGISVLTTYQHHFIDIPTGLLLGWFSVWLWPDDGRSPLKKAVHNHHFPKNLRIAAYFASAAAVIAVISLVKGNLFLWFIWPAASLLLISSFYLWSGSNGFQKQSNGKINLAVHWLLFPYLFGVKIHSSIRKLKSDHAAYHIMDGVWIGHFPGIQDLKNEKYRAVVDLTSELSAPSSEIQWHSLPSLNLLPPHKHDLRHTVNLIEKLQTQGPILVTGSPGISRSAMAAAAWLAASRRTETIEEAVGMLQDIHPSFRFNPDEIDIINNAVKM